MEQAFGIVNKNLKSLYANTPSLILYLRDVNFYGSSVVTTKNCKHFQFSTDYGKHEFFYGDFLKK